MALKKSKVFARNSCCIEKKFMSLKSNHKIDHLIAGFIRTANTGYIPVCITRFITVLYKCEDEYFVIIHGTYGVNANIHNGITFYNLSTNNAHRFKNILNNDVTNNINDALSFGCCIAKHNNKMNKFSKIFNTDENNDRICINDFNTYYMFRIGGNCAKNTKLFLDNFEAVCYNMDSNKPVINGYIAELKSAPIKVVSNSLIYSDKANKLYCIGGKIRDNKKTERLKSIYTYDFESLLWNNIPYYMNNSRSAPSLCKGYNNNIMIIGGYNTINYDLNSCEIFNIQNNRCINTSNMNYGRFYCGSIYDNINKRIIVAGGDNDKNEDIVSKTVELYDYNKNKWILFNNKMLNTHTFPRLLMDIHNCKGYKNPNILYVIGSEWGGRENNDFSGYIEYCDLRIGEWKLYDDKSLFEMIGIDYNNINSDGFRGRELQTFTF